MKGSNLKLGRLCIIFGFAILAIIWLVVFNSSADENETVDKQLLSLTYFKEYSVATYPEGTLSYQDVCDYDVVVYNGWGPWCHNCVEEMPILEKLSHEYNEKGLLVVGVVADYNEQIVKKPNYINEIGDVVLAYDITYPNCLSDQKFFDEVYPTMKGTFPATWVVDKEGNLIDFFIGAKSEEQWRSLFDQWLEMESN